MADLERAKALFQQALVLHSAERLDEAEALYRRALELAPERPSVLVNLGAVALRRGRGREAQRLARRALAREPDSAEALSLLIEAKRAREGVAAALTEADHLLNRHPRVAALHLQRSSLLAEQGRLEAALEAIERALGIEPRDPVALTHRAQLLLACRREDEALAELVEQLRREPRNLAAGEIWARVQLRHGQVPSAQAELLVRALDTPWAAPRELLPLACAHLHADPRLATWLQRVDAAWPQRLPAHSLVDLRLPTAVFAQPVLRALLRQPLVPDPTLQRLLINLRGWLLERAAHGGADAVWSEAQLGFACALAAHVLRNQHLWTLSPAEAEWAELLQQRLQAALGADAPMAAGWLPSLLSARPVGLLSEPQRLLGRRWPASVQALLAQALAADDLADTLAGLPSLRWSRLTASPRALQLPDFLADRVWPPATIPTVQTVAPKRLALACGAGEWALEFATRIQGGSTLALDTDADCVAALRQQVQRLQLANVELRQGLLDVVDADDFDLIDSGRAFLRDASALAQALPRLASKLGPRGLLRVRLPSMRLRAALSDARARLRAAGVDAADDDALRTARELILALAPTDTAASLAQVPEFHQAGACRELLFRTADSGLSLADLAAHLAATGLRWVGFELSAAERQLCSESLQPADLPGWAELEADLPQLFLQHYTLWLAPA